MFSSRDRSSAGSIAFRSSAGSQNGPRAESSSSFSSVSGSIWAGLGATGSSQTAQFVLHELAFGVGQFAVVNAELGELAVEARAAAGAWPAEMKRRDGWIRRKGFDSFPGAGCRSVAVQRHSLWAPGEANQLETRIRAYIHEIARPTLIAEDRVQPAATFEHQSESMLACVRIFPAEQTVAWSGCAVGPEDDKQAAGRRHPSWEAQQ